MTLELRQGTSPDMFDDKKTQIIKDVFCKGASDEEFQIFMLTCERLKLDPCSRQIYPVKRYDANLKKEVMTIQTGIDGYRLIADRTGMYAPGKDPEFIYDSNGNLFAAKAFVKKQTRDGTWHEVSAIAHYSEYAALKRDGSPTHMWATKPHIMLAKCAEALALRKAFPAELSGVYTREEMDNANSEYQEIRVEQKKITYISDSQIAEIEKELGEDQEFRKQLLDRLQKAFGGKEFEKIPQDQYVNVMKVIQKHNMEKEKKALEEYMEKSNTEE